MVARLYYLFIITLSILSVSAQPSTDFNLVPNGNFEKKDVGFYSEYNQDANYTPGSYIVTNNAPAHHADLSNPLYGDHTKVGRGYFMVINANGYRGKKMWCAPVKVVPNARYEFSAYFCNVYALLPPKSNFAIDEGDIKGNDPELKVSIGSEVIAIEKDFYHLFRWVKITGTWYSGGHSSIAEICLENLNTSINGNDLALDDISFNYIETMPEGYEPPRKTVTVVDRLYQAPKEANKKTSLSTYGEFEYNDSVADGVYVLHTKPWRSIAEQLKEQEAFQALHKEKVNERLVLHSVSFDQTKAELKEATKSYLDLVAQWMQRDSSVRVRFIGHTDNQGDPLLNIKLSEERVLNVKAYLIEKGIVADRIETVGYGGAYPISDNSTEDARKLNRRVEMEILSK